MRQENAQRLLGQLERPEPEKQLKVEIDRAHENLVDKVLDIYRRGDVFGCLTPIVELSRSLVLSNKIVNDVVLRMQAEGRIEASGRTYSWPEKFVTELVCYSYAAGYNDFTLIGNFQRGLFADIHPYAFGMGGVQRHSWNEKLRATIIGNVGHSFGENVSGVELTLKGNIVGEECYCNCARGAKDSVFKSNFDAALKEISMGVGKNCALYAIRNGKEYKYNLFYKFGRLVGFVK
ncbi:MAG: hypothetical protein HY438_02870 [DPANN group archaeon]|nr:hypothetical protein [DPANN group archaeon]